MGDGIQISYTSDRAVSSSEAVTKRFCEGLKDQSWRESSTHPALPRSGRWTLDTRAALDRNDLRDPIDPTGPQWQIPVPSSRHPPRPADIVPGEMRELIARSFSFNMAVFRGVYRHSTFRRTRRRSADSSVFATTERENP
jgi:hypothetical protein